MTGSAPLPRLDVPARLVPYLADLLATGLYGTLLQDVVVRLLEDGIRAAIQDALIDQRKDGEVEAV